VIGVIDLRDGQAVHARGGRRDEYQPIGDAVELARTYVEGHGVAELYVADLDAIVERPFQGRGVGDPERVALRTISKMAPLWLDAGVSTVESARNAVDAGAARVVVGLETLSSFSMLQDICEAVGGQGVAFSLDLRDGAPLGIGRGERAEQMAARAVEAGVKAVIVLDLARVGMRTGLDCDQLAKVRAAAPQVELIAGGGVRDVDDLARLADAGYAAALVATALRDGSLATRKESPHSGYPIVTR
jgi:phosphoribosylformimino-5-aminoimidazole carboxamide ribotide isomerase